MAIFVFFPSLIASAIIWPGQTANQFVGRALAIAGGVIALLAFIAVSLAAHGRR